MHPMTEAFLARLTYGNWRKLPEAERSSVVETLARVYEKARNALEYRADHLVRRAAIERILKRVTIFEKEPANVARMLWEELNWARYILPAELDASSVASFEQILTKYLHNASSPVVPRDWIMGVASAEIEQSLNLNVDYHSFAKFTFQVLRKKLIVDERQDMDLMLYVAVDKVYSLADDQLTAFHVVQLAQKQASVEFSEVLLTSYNQVKAAMGDPLFSKVSNFVRRNSAPFILLRDMYFSNPASFKEVLTDEATFKHAIKKVLDTQLLNTTKTMRTAAFRSILYVFLTKMLFGFLVEVPIDLLLLGHVGYLGLAINLAFPPITMWLMTLDTPIPNIKTQELIINRAWQIVTSPDHLVAERIGASTAFSRSTAYMIFSAVYAVVFLAIFIGIFWGLNLLHFSLASQLIFVFFLCIVAFFAYRIRQYAKIYSIHESYGPKSSLWDMLVLPILAVGNVFSRSLGKLNFFVIAFDFILEAPFKIILQFLNNWVQFLSLKKEEVVG